MQKFIFYYTIFIAITSFSYAKNVPIDADQTELLKEKQTFEPWFTGPLLAGSGHTVPADHVLWEPYLFATESLGIYDDHWKTKDTPKNLSITPLCLFVYGINSFMDFQMMPTLSSNFQQGSHDTRLNDLPLSLGFQVLHDKPKSWEPDIRLLIREIFPTGHYEHLNPDNNGTDATGLGSFQTGLGLNSQKLFTINAHLLRLRLNFNWVIPSTVFVRSFNSFGGGFGTRGKIRPGQTFSSIFAIEYMFSQHFVGALDIQYLFSGKNRFSGYKGLDAKGQKALIGSPASHQFSLAPGLEYNFNVNTGLIFGVWFSVVGKNSNRFVSGVIALNYYH
ncbi:MAG: hypothetical protein WCG10_03035 [Chlamydiota bacterium]